MSKRYYLRRKTERKNFSEDKNIEKPKETIVKLISLNDSKYNINDYTYIKFSSSKKIKLCGLMEKKSQIIKLNLNPNKICVIDKIELINEKGNKRETFLLPIYIRKSNSCYISLKYKKRGFCFEFIFYSKNKKAMSKYILTQKVQSLDIFDNYGLNYRKKNKFNQYRKKFG